MIEPAANQPPANQPARETLVIAPGRVRPRYLDQEPPTASSDGWHNGKTATLVVLFVVTAAFGIAMLWRNDRFVTWERWFWSTIVIVYTAGILAAIVAWVRLTMSDLPIW